MFQIAKSPKPILTLDLGLHSDHQQTYDLYSDSDDCSSENSIKVSTRPTNQSRVSFNRKHHRPRSRWSTSARPTRIQHLQGETSCRTTSGYVRDIRTPHVPFQKMMYMNGDGQVSALQLPSNFNPPEKLRRETLFTTYSQQSQSDLLSAVHKAWYRSQTDLEQTKVRKKSASDSSRDGKKYRPVTIGGELAARPNTSKNRRESKSANCRLFAFGTHRFTPENSFYNLNELKHSTEIVSKRLKMMMAERLATDATAQVGGRRRRRWTRYKEEEPVVVVDPDKPSRMYRKFRMIAILTTTMVKLLWVIIGISQTKSIRTATELQWETLYSTRVSDRKMSFDKTYYSKERASTTMPKWAIRILDTPPQLRSEEDCRKIHTMMRGMRSFDKFTENIQFSLCRAFTYQYVTEGRVILRKGHVGYNFYFVFSGSAFVNVEDVDGSGEKFVKTEAVVKKGDSFGELALLQNVTRTATVAVRETIELLVVHQDVFAKVCPQIFEKELREKEIFLRRLPIFTEKWWPKEALRNLCLEAQIQEYSINKLIVKDSRRDNWIYICMEGKAEIIRCLTLEEDVPGNQANRLKKRQSMFLSEDLVELFRNLSPAVKNKGSKIKEEYVARDLDKDEKEKLLESLGLEYVATGKRQETFIEELEESERKKELEYILGPKTLSALMADEIEKGKKDLVYLNIGTLHPFDIFDIHSIINEEGKANSYHLLVSYGARILKIKKSDLFRYSTADTIDHIRNITAKNEYPTDKVLLESYRQKSQWDDYKTQLVTKLLQPNLHNKHRFPQGHLKKSQARETDEYKQRKLISTLKKNEKLALKEENETKLEEADIERRQSTALIDLKLSIDEKRKFPGSTVHFGEPIIVRRKSIADIVQREDTLNVNIPLDRVIRRSKTMAEFPPILEEVTEEPTEIKEIKLPKSVTIVT